jgi:RHS repeat-associated protein
MMPVAASNPATPLRWERVYDRAGRLSSVTTPARHRTEFSYDDDAAGRTETARCLLPDGSRITRRFDAQGRLAEVTRESPTSRVALRYTWDEWGRLQAADYGDGLAVEFGRDTEGRVVSWSVGAGLSVRLEFDFLGRLETIATPTGSIRYEYQAGANRTVRRLPNGVWTVWEFRPDGRLQSLAHANAGNQVILKLDYSYRPDGLIGEVREWTGGRESLVRYAYDRMHRLTAVESPEADARYEYDLLGNRTRLSKNGTSISTCAFDWAERLLEIGGRACRHDDSGNLVGLPGPDGDSTFAFDGANYLSAAETPRGCVDYGHDGNGRVVTRTTAVGTTRYLPDPMSNEWQPLLEIDPRGKKTLYAWDGGVLVAVLEDGVPCYPLQDHLGSVRAWCDASGLASPSISRDAFGESVASTPDTELRPGFSGLFHDPVAGVALTARRAYVPALGRFLQRDPQWSLSAVSVKDLSAYAYCGADPVNYTDRDGCSPQSVATGSPVVRSLNAIAEWSTSFHRVQAGQAGEWLGSSGQVGWVGAGLAATFTDLWAGLVPGQTTTTGQAYGAAFWKLALVGLAVTNPELVVAAAVVQTVRGGWSAAANLGAGKWLSAGLDVLGVAGTGAGFAARGLSPLAFRSGSGQFQFGFSTPLVGRLNAVSQSVRSFGLFKTAGDVWNAPSLGQTVVAPDTALAAPASIGGIYLRGAGRSLEGIGRLTGIGLDAATGRLVLLADGRETRLPDLHIDDVVTIFRSVYERGEAPFVSIDPKRDAPDGPLMVTRHGEGTRDSYVGWVLFEADRVMKAYSLGIDNVSRRPIVSAVPGYTSLLTSGGFDQRHGDDRVWERFWIVPAGVTRRCSTGGEVTLFDIPLKVMTQRMRLHDGQLVPADDDRPSAAAERFANWFSARFGELSGEVMSEPPAGRASAAVPVFEELHRVALITAIAERLCEDGAAMPPWMREWETRPCKVDQTTPAITVTHEGMETISERRWWGASRETQARVRRSIYGGVNLAADEASVRTLTAGDGVVALAVPLVRRAAVMPACFTPMRADSRDEAVAVSLPGAAARVLGACSLTETDVEVPIGHGESLTLSRCYQSFSRPTGELGAGWTLDCPRLVRQVRRVRQQGDRVQTAVVYLLCSPLYSVHARFDRRAFSPEMQGELLVSTGAAEILGLAGDLEPITRAHTTVVIFRDGRRWHFDEEGRLVAVARSPFTRVYRRDGAGRLQAIEGWCGHACRARMLIDCDEAGRLARIDTDGGVIVRYGYSQAGELEWVDGPAGRTDYSYLDGCLVSKATGGRTVHRWTFDGRGRLTKEWTAEKGIIVHEVKPTETGLLQTVSAGDSGIVLESAEYDQLLRPTARTLRDGTSIRWTRDAGESIAVRTAEGRELMVRRTMDGRASEIILPDGPVLRAILDEAGRPVEVNEGDAVFRQEWRHDGQLGVREDSSTAWRHEYGSDGTHARTLVTPPGPATSFSRWLAWECDEAERPARVTDYSGLGLELEYDAHGRLSTWRTQQGAMVWRRDGEGRVESMATTWGLSSGIHRDSDGGIVRLEVVSEGGTVGVDFVDSVPRRIHQADGGVVAVTVEPATGSGNGAGACSTTWPNGLRVRQDYDRSGRPVATVCGSGFRIECEYDEYGRCTALQRVRTCE